MIKGIGVDIVDIKRVEELVHKMGWEKFAERILSDEEMKPISSDNFQNLISHLAKRFAAKEAIGKALGTGIGKTSFKDIVITKEEESGRPLVKIVGQEDLKVHLSLADEPPFAIAYAMIE